MNFEVVEKFLKEISELYEKIPKKEKTWMEVSGYPHYENVCSNILAFYLNPKEEHGLEEKVLKALYHAIKEKKEIEDVHFSNMTIFREYTTLKGNRIDIVIQNEEMVIGIENKIMASLYNDLEDYAKTLEKINPNAIKVVLSLHKETESNLKGGFINITYQEFFKYLKQELGKEEKLNKWYLYLKDFIQNLEGFEVEKEMELEVKEWIKKHQEDIDKLNEIINVAKKNIMKKAKEYGSLFEADLEAEYKVKYAEEKIEVTSYVVFDIGCNLDAKLTIDGWRIGVFAWKKMNQVKIKQALKEHGYDSIEEENNHNWLFEFDYDTPIETIVDTAKKIKSVIQEINR